jgi:hypothetical protein
LKTHGSILPYLKQIAAALTGGGGAVTGLVVCFEHYHDGGYVLSLDEFADRVHSEPDMKSQKKVMQNMI